MAGAWLLQLDPEKPQPKAKGYFPLTQKKTINVHKKKSYFAYIHLTRNGC